MAYRLNRFEYEEAKQLLETISPQQEIHEDFYGSLAFFGLAKYYRELMFLHTNHRRFAKDFAIRAIQFFMKANLPYAAVKLFEDLKNLGFCRDDLIEIAEHAGLNKEGYIEIIINFDDAIRDQRVLKKYIEKILRCDISTLEKSLLLRKLIRELNTDIPLIQLETLLLPIKNFDATLYCKLLGLFLTRHEKPNLLRIIIEKYDVDCALNALYEYSSEISNPSKLSYASQLINELTQNIVDLSSRSLKLLARITSNLLDKNINVASDLVEKLIQILYKRELIDETIMLSSSYSRYLLNNNPQKSLVFLDLAIMLSYQINEKATVTEILSHYIEHTYKEKLYDWLEKIIDLIYKENKILGIQNYLLFEKLVDIVREDDTKFIADIIRSIADRYPHTQRFLLPIIDLLKIKFHPSKTNLTKILSSHPLFIVKAAKILSLSPKNILLFASLLKNSKIKAPDKISTYYMITNKIKNNDALLQELLKIVLEDTDIRESPKFPTFLLDLAQQIKGINNEQTLVLTKLAYEEFEKRHMFWMAINALALLRAIQTFMHDSTCNPQTK